MRLIRTVLAVVLLVTSSTVPVGAVAAATQEGEAYAGTHVEFETASNAIVDYSVNGETVFKSVKLQSQSNAESQGDVRAGASLSAVTELTGAALSLDSQTEVTATVTAESGAQMQAHDNSRGILVIQSSGDSQYVTVNVSSASQVDSESDQRVVVTTEDGTEGTFLVVGDGQVAVNDRGDVSAQLGSNSTLVFRAYPEERDDGDQQQEQLISEGKTVAEVYVMESSEQGSEFATDVVQYSEDTTVEVTQQTRGTVTMTADRSQERGKIILTSVSEQAISSVEDLQVTVDGEAAAQASSYNELESAANNGDTSKFLVHQQSSAQASADILVAVNHFSSREVTISNSSNDSNASGGSNSDGSDGDQEATGADGPGFGPIVTLFALVAAFGLARRQ